MSYVLCDEPVFPASRWCSTLRSYNKPKCNTCSIKPDAYPDSFVYCSEFCGLSDKKCIVCGIKQDA